MAKKIYTLYFILFFLLVNVTAQNIAPKLRDVWAKFTNDSQLQCGLTGICVMDAQTGNIVFSRNENIGMAPASTQKIFTAVAAFEALGKDFRYQTHIGYSGNIVGKILNGDLVIEGSGDPSFGSWRYDSTKANFQLNQIANIIKKLGVDSVTGNFICTNKGFDINPVPDGWQWDDMGNYYGAGHWPLNWKENQYDAFFNTGNVEGDETILEQTDPVKIPQETFLNQAKTGTRNSGDESVIYASPFSKIMLVQGKLEAKKKHFGVTGAMPMASSAALQTIRESLAQQGIQVKGENQDPLYFALNQLGQPQGVQWVDSIASPSLDSLVFWFLRKSINLYGEALQRTIGLNKNGFGSTDAGIDWENNFYKQNGFQENTFHMRDGSGLSMSNRITPMAEVKALQLAKTKSWFPYFYDALPLYNGMKLKSGTVHRTKCFAGYHTAKNGKQYIVSLMVNNYNGSTNALVNKMFAVLDVLK